MKIAIVAPIEEPVPPLGYGGIESVISYLVEHLQTRAHEVVLLAAGNSKASCKLVPTVPAGLRSAGASPDPGPLRARKHAVAATIVPAIEAERPDVIHNHFRYLIPLASRISIPILTTVHDPLDRGHPREVYFEHPRMEYVSISWSQQASAPQLRFVANVYHGIPVESFEFNEQPEPYLAFLGRASPDKGIDVAIEVARRCGMMLKIAAKIEHEHRWFFRRKVEPLIDGQRIEFLGEVDQHKKRRLLRDAAALLCPVRWSEPFGLVSIEAMACGTPVIAFAKGALPEIISHGQTGFIAKDVDEMVSTVGWIGAVSRRACRDAASRRFHSSRMAMEYEQLYQRVAARTG